MRLLLLCCAGGGDVHVGAGRAVSRCQQVVNAVRQGQVSGIFNTRRRVWRTRRAGRCHVVAQGVGFGVGEAVGERLGVGEAAAP